MPGIPLWVILFGKVLNAGGIFLVATLLFSSICPEAVDALQTIPRHDMRINLSNIWTLMPDLDLNQLQIVRPSIKVSLVGIPTRVNREMRR